jgi:hypothetical protein
MEMTPAISEGLGILCVVEPLLSLRLHCPNLEIGPGFTVGTGTARLRTVQGFFALRASVLIFHPIRQSNLALARAKVLSQNTPIKLGIYGAMQSPHVVLVKRPKNGELRKAKAN